MSLFGPTGPARPALAYRSSLDRSRRRKAQLLSSSPTTRTFPSRSSKSAEPTRTGLGTGRSTRLWRRQHADPTPGIEAGVDIAVARPWPSGRPGTPTRHSPSIESRSSSSTKPTAWADMGFARGSGIARLTNADRQTLLFSATLDGDIAVLGKRIPARTDPPRSQPAEPDMTSMQHLAWRADKSAKTELVGLLERAIRHHQCNSAAHGTSSTRSPSA